MAGSGTTALASDINSPGAIGVNLMGTGGSPSYNYGYGQVTYGSGSTVGTSTLVAGGYYDQIRYDLLNASAHQNGSAAALSVAAEVSGQLINSTNATAFASYASTVESNRLTAHSSRLSTLAWGSASRTSSWKSSVTTTYTITFSSSNVARFFWNAGGRIRFTASRSGGSSSAQNTAWTNLLSSAGTQSYGANEVYTVGVLTQLYQATSSAPYSNNKYTIACNQNGSVGSSNAWSFYFTWSDPYVDPSPGNPPSPDDLVDGTLSISAEIVYPTGGASLYGGSNTWRGFNNGGAGGYYALPSQSFNGITGG